MHALTPATAQQSRWRGEQASQLRKRGGCVCVSVCLAWGCGSHPQPTNRPPHRNITNHAPAHRVVIAAGPHNVQVSIRVQVPDDHTVGHTGIRVDGDRQEDGWVDDANRVVSPTHPQASDHHHDHKPQVAEVTWAHAWRQQTGPGQATMLHTHLRTRR